MSTITKFIAAVARHPVNFIAKVAEDVQLLNEAEANKPQAASKEDLAEALELLAAKKARGGR